MILLIIIIIQSDYVYLGRVREERRSLSMFCCLLREGSVLRRNNRRSSSSVHRPSSTHGNIALYKVHRFETKTDFSEVR